MKIQGVIAVLGVFSLFVLGCPVRPGDEDSGQVEYDGGPGTDGGGNDAGNTGGLQIKDLQDTSSPDFPGADAQVTLIDKVVTSPLFNISTALDGFFISDPSGGAFSGILVTVPAGEVTVAIHDQVDVEGTLTEFTGQTGNTGTETQLDATRVTVRGQVSPLAATVAPAMDFDSDATAEQWEGVLVRLENVSIQLFLDGSLVSFGQFQVTGGALVDDQLYEYAPGSEEVFTSITGVVRYTYYGDYVLMPRDADDIVSASGARVITDSSPASVQNYDAGDHPEVCATTSERCNPVRLTQMVVTSPVFGVSRESNCLPDEEDYGCPYYMYGFYLADPGDVDGNGRANPWSGIKVTVIPGNRWVRGSECDSLSGQALVDCGAAGSLYDSLDTNYTFAGHFAKDMASQNMTDGFPAVGDIVTLVGEPAEYYDMTQLGRLEVLTTEGNVSDGGAAVSMPLPAQFDGDVSSITSGMPRVPETGTPEVRAELAPGADTEKYEAVPVELINVVTSEECVPYPYSGNANDMRDFGYFRVAAASGSALHGVEIGTFEDSDWGGFWRSTSTPGAPSYAERTCDNLANKCDDARRLGQSFSRITGLVDYSYGVHRLEPFDTANIVCTANCDPKPNPDFCP